jgi:hypothetical protein
VGKPRARDDERSAASGAGRHSTGVHTALKRSAQDIICSVAVNVRER